MKAVFLKGSLLLLAASLAGCSTMRGGGSGDQAGGIEATRFHLGQPVAKGQIAVEAFDPADANMVEFPAYASSVNRQLTRLGWTVAASNRQTEQVALIDVQQGSRAALTGRVGGAAAIGASASPNSVATLLEVRIRRRSDGTVIWEGRAISEAPAAATGAQRTAAVEKLAEALFRDFPGESGRTIRLR
jgi:predicted small secreted protein